MTVVMATVVVVVVVVVVVNLNGNWLVVETVEG